MRKRIVGTVHPEADEHWLDLQNVAIVEVSSEDAHHGIEGALVGGTARGWRAGEPGVQTIRLIFEERQDLHRIKLCFIEPAIERTQEFILRWSAEEAQPLRDIVRQQWNFSPAGSTIEIEDYRVALPGVSALELVIRPDLRRSDVVATLAEWRVG